MPDIVELKTSGLRELQAMLADLPDRIGKKVVKSALGEAARTGRDALKAEARKHEARGFLAATKSGRQKTRHLADTAIVVQKVYGEAQYAAVGFSYPQGAAGWLVEHGHRIVTGGTVARISGRQTGKAPRSTNAGLTGAGQVVGQVPPHPIARPAFESIVSRMEDTFISGVESRADTELRDAARG